MDVRLVSPCPSRTARIAGASALVGILSLLFPVIASLAATPAAARTARPYAVAVAQAAQRFSIPEAWIRAVMRVESNGDPAAISRAGAIGLMQIMPGTWRQLTARHGLGDNPWDVRANILGGAAYLREMVDRYGDLPTAFAAYNAGPGRVDDWHLRGRPLPAETIAYVAKIAPTLDISGVASSAVPPSGPDGPATPSWRDAALFVPRDNGKAHGGDPVPDPAPNVQPIDLAAAQSLPSPVLPSHSSSPPSRDLFIPLSGRSER